MDVNIHVPNKAAGREFYNQLNGKWNPQNGEIVYDAATNTVKAMISNDREAALRLLAQVVTAQPWYLGGALERPLAEALVGTAEVLNGRAEYIDSVVNDAVSGRPMDRVQEKFDRAESHASPIILDMDGDGIETLGLEAGVQFDHNGDGFAQASGWVGPDDALLAMDLSGNDAIEDGSELFGNASEVADGVTAMNGFEALVIHDSNDNGHIDADDEAWGDLRLWQDVDADGEVDDGEMLTLDEVGIGSIDLDYTNSADVDNNDNQHRQIGRFEWADGREGAATDVWFIQDTADTKVLERLEVPGEIASMPDLKGYGEVYDLHQALVRDDSGRLREQVEAFIAEMGVSARRSGMQALLYEWAGVTDVDPGSRGRFIDARKVAALEAFLGQEFSQHGSPNPRSGASAQLREGFALLESAMYDQLMRQTHLVPYLGVVDVTVDGSGIGTDFTGTMAVLRQQFDADQVHAVGDLLELDRVAGEQLAPMGFHVDGLLRDWLAGAEVSPAMQATLDEFGWKAVQTNRNGTTAPEIVIGENAGAVLDGNGGDDWLLGGDGDDLLEGGSGDDLLRGGQGANTYRFQPGWGEDSIREYGAGVGQNVLEFGAGIEPGDLLVRADGDSLVLAHRNGRDWIVLVNGLQEVKAAGGGLGRIRFSDGREFSLSTVDLGTDADETVTGQDLGNLLLAAGGDDELAGGDGNDVLFGGDGNDVVDGGAGNDWLDGGSSDDRLVGGTGDDVYVVDGGDEVLETADGGTDTVHSSVNWTLSEHIENLTLLGGKPVYATGNEADNVLRGNGRGNRLDGGIGADRMAGGSGDDTYVVDEAGDIVMEAERAGVDTVESSIDQALSANVECLHLTGQDDLSGTGNELDNEMVGNSGDNILTAGGGDDRLDGAGGVDTMVGGSGDDTYVVDDVEDQVVEHADEGQDLVQTSLDYTLGEYFEDMTLTGSTDAVGTGNASNNRLIGSAGGNLLSGREGDDHLLGHDGDDILDGGAGDDRLDGGRGCDIYRFGYGSGHDRIDENVYRPSVTDANTLAFGTNVAPNDVVLRRSGDDLVVALGDGKDRLTVDDYFWGDANSGGRRIEELRFYDGTVWGVDHVKQQVQVGTTGADTLYGYDAADEIDGGAGDDTTYGRAGADVLSGGAGDDRLEGGDGDDVLDGGAGDDRLDGGRGSDIYRFGFGSGHDLIEEHVYGSTVMDVNALAFEDDVTPGEVTLRRSDSDLLVILGDGTDQLTVDSYFWHDANSGGQRIEELRFADGSVWDVDHVKQQVLVGTEAGETLTGYDVADVIDGLGGEDDISGHDGADVLSGGAGNDRLDGDNGADQLLGGSGQDRLYGEDGNDVLVGGTEGDLLDGGLGSDVYRFGFGDGQDRIVSHNYNPDPAKVDAIEFQSGVLFSDVMLRRSGQDLVVVLGDGTDTLTVEDYFWNDANSGERRVEELRFSDGTVWDVNDVKQQVLVGTDASEVLIGYDVADTIDGLAGNDTIHGHAGNDALSGGDGADVLSSNEGDDMVFGEAGNDRLHGGAGNDALYGAVGDDDLYGGAGDDRLTGGQGDDTLEGGAGSDTYVFHGGHGADEINAFDTTAGRQEAVEFSAAIAPDDIHARRRGDDLLLLNVNGTDQVTIRGHFRDETRNDSTIQAVRFSDGTVWNLSDLNELVLQGSAGDDVLEGHLADDAITGGAGSDTLYGRDGADSLYGDAGADTLYGEVGGDTLIGGAGGDRLEGGQGDDVYEMAAADGADRIFDTQGNDRLRLTDTSSADVVLRRDGGDLPSSSACA